MWYVTSRRLHVFQDSALNAFTLRDGSVEAVSSVRNLGAYFDEVLTMKDHVNRLVHIGFYQRWQMKTIVNYQH